MNSSRDLVGLTGLPTINRQIKSLERAASLTQRVIMLEADGVEASGSI
jgi:hypothetical protein